MFPVFLSPLQNISNCFVTQLFCLHVRRLAEEAMAAAREFPHPLPWQRASPLNRELLGDASCNGAPRFHKVDMWHAYHLGVGKAWGAAGLLMIQDFFDGSSMDERFKNLTASYKSFCRETKLTAHIGKIDKYLCGGGGSNEPLGTWSKAAVTTNICLFIESFFAENPGVMNNDEGIYYMVPCSHANILWLTHHICFNIILLYIFVNLY